MSDAVKAQVRAATPSASSWVSANAGSGKTRVLTDRVARLLLAGTEPQKILCLTYTKAAAAEMQNRLFRTLGAWSMLDDGALQGRAPARWASLRRRSRRAQLARARTLFARALETPGGLKIQTIHAFCEALLRRFPLEAEVAPGFGVLEDRQARALREAVLDSFATDAPADFAAMARQMPGDDPDPLLLEIAQHRAAFVDAFDADALAAMLGATGEDPAALAARVLLPGDEALLGSLVPILAASGVSDCKAGNRLAEALANADPSRRLENLESVFLTGDGTAEPFSAKIGKFPTNAVRAKHPALMPGLEALMRRVEAARAPRLANAALIRSGQLNHFARAWRSAYGARKQAAGLLDFDDLIDLAVALLKRPGTAAWVLWRLDGGLDHILVDEAQDTSPAQWQVINALSEEFFAGAGARAVERTIFVVGDEKQSIYSFQGADPREFGDKAKHYTKVLADIDLELQHCALLHSFRSAQPILALVDAVFGGVAKDGLSGAVAHHAFKPEKPGRVELWPFLPKPEKPDELPWDHPVDARAVDDPLHILADRIAGTISGWLTSGRTVPGEERAIRPGDVMILVQRRSELFDAIIRALKRARVPVAGADLLRIGGELAVNDLLAALRFAATPDDDLSLAAFLRSPLGGVSERELFELAHPRTGTLWQALREAPAGRWPEARAILEDLRQRVDFQRPFELLARILVRHGGRRKLVARLGPEAEDGIDALVDQALAYESVEAPSVTGFLDWFDRDEVKVKRRSDEGADQVRVMTVHGAKGLEAPIVILPDTAARSDAANPPQIMRLANGQPVWKVASNLAPPAFREAEEERRKLIRLESRRLLYVGLTRAKSWLIVCGAGQPATPKRESWYDLVANALDTLEPVAEPGPDGDVLVLSHNWIADVAPAPAAPAVASALADWTRRPAGAPATERPALSPSGLGGAHVLAGEAAGGLDEAAAKARGTALHRLLEHLHGRPAGDRLGLAARLLPREPALEELVAEASALLDAPELGFVFGAGSMAEVEVTAPLKALGGARILGRLDRLVVGPERVLAIDFKSHRSGAGDAGAGAGGHPAPDGRVSRRAGRDLAGPPDRDGDPVDADGSADAAAGRSADRRAGPCGQAGSGGVQLLDQRFTRGKGKARRVSGVGAGALDRPHPRTYLTSQLEFILEASEWRRSRLPTRRSRARCSTRASRSWWISGRSGAAPAR